MKTQQERWSHRTIYTNRSGDLAGAFPSPGRCPEGSPQTIGLSPWWNCSLAHRRNRLSRRDKGYSSGKNHHPPAHCMCLTMGKRSLEKILNLFYNYARNIAQGSTRVLLSPSDKQDLALVQHFRYSNTLQTDLSSFRRTLIGKREYNFLFCTLKFREGGSI